MNLRLTGLLTFGLMAALSISAAAADEPSLFESAAGSFAIGAAVTSAQIKDPATSKLILHQFNCLTGEFEFMPEFLEPKPGKFTFDTGGQDREFRGLPIISPLTRSHALLGTTDAEVDVRGFEWETVAFAPRRWRI